MWFWLRELCSISCADLILSSVYMSTYYMEAACHYHNKSKGEEGKITSEYHSIVEAVKNLFLPLIYHVYS